MVDRRRGWASAVAALLVALLFGEAAQAEQIALGPAQRPRIVNGVDTHGYPTAGALLYSNSDLSAAGSWCSGTLIGCNTFLVAGHCVDDANPAHYLVYLQHAGLLPVASVTRHPNYLAATFPRFDVAVLELATWVTGIDATPVNQSDPGPFIPEPGTIVGFGQTMGLGNDYGIKRTGQVETAACPGGLPGGATAADVVCWHFLAPVGAPGTDSNTCNGDSGGPLFMDLGGGTVLAGVTSGGFSADCLADDVSYDANVYTHSAFILGELGADSVAACGGLAPVGSPQTSQTAFDGALSGLDQVHVHSVSVPAGANALRVTLNATDDGVFDADLFVKQGLGASPSSFDCASDGESTYGACAIDLPAAGTWSIAVVRAAGAGDYQLTATVFGGAPPVCGNGTREFNESCDGADASPCPGACTASCDCPLACTPNDLIEIKARVDAAKLKLRGRLLNLAGEYNGIDPRDGIGLTLTQGANSLHVEIPPNAPGWEGSRPDRGRFKWKGDLGGISRVKLIDRTAKTGTMKVIVIGKDVPGAAAIDSDQPMDITLTIDGVCTTTTY